MTVSTDYSRLDTGQKAALIYAQAHDAVTARLWRAALGSHDMRDSERDPTSTADPRDVALDALLAMITPKAELPPAGSTPAFTLTPVTDQTIPDASALIPAMARPTGPVATSSDLVTGLGPNARFGQALITAASRTGLPAAALAAIVDAEAGKDGDGSWKTASRNPRSSAAGLGQFLGGTWQSEAERTGTWLNATASSQGWLGRDGRVLAGARSALLALRYDATASINATADYALRSVEHLKRAGVTVGEDLTTITRAAYLGHHLGTGDAIRFFKGGLDNGRARLLLDAQVGSAAASRWIARSADAASAHRSWLLDFVDRHVTPARFAS